MGFFRRVSDQESSMNEAAPLHLYRLDKELEANYMRPGIDPAIRQHCWRLHAELVRLGVRRDCKVRDNSEEVA